MSVLRNVPCSLHVGCHGPCPCGHRKRSKQPHYHSVAGMWEEVKAPCSKPPEGLTPVASLPLPCSLLNNELLISDHPPPNGRGISVMTEDTGA